MAKYITLTFIHYCFVSKCKSFTGFVLEVHELERPQHVECKLLAAGAAWSSHFHVLRSFQSMHPSHSSGNYYLLYACIVFRYLLVGKIAIMANADYVVDLKTDFK